MSIPRPDAESGGFGRIEDLFHRLKDEPPSTRREMLDELATNEPELVATLEELLAAADGEDTLLDASAMASALSSPLGLSEGTVVGGFRVEELIDSGGMGTVYRATQERPRRDVALKVMRPGLASPALLARFELESEILGTLDHDGIAKVFAAGVADVEGARVPYMAMELIDGVDLAGWAAGHAPSAHDVVDLVMAVSEAVAHAHQRGVIHRDLKPSNVLVTTDGRPKVLDFGVARMGRGPGPGRLTDDEAASSGPLHTQAGQIIGTLAYMSPEQTTGDPGAVDTRTDVWALGVILHELLCGRRPFDVEMLPLPEALRAIREDPPPRLSESTVIDVDLETIVAKALAKDRDDRYDGAAEFAADLRRWSRHEPIAARRASATYVLKKLVRRNPVLSFATVFGVVFLVVALFVVMRERDRADREARAAKAARREVFSLSDDHRLRDLRTRAATLFPPHPDREDDLRTWLADAERLYARLSRHRATLAGLDDDGGGADAITDLERSWQRENVVRLIDALEAFGGEDGLIEGVRDRLDVATRIAEETTGRHAGRWAEVCDAIAASEVYGGLRLAPQMGLIPLGPDPVSGRHEFLHWLTHEGPLPERNDDGDLRVGERAGVIFVLLPGGKVKIGAQPHAEDRPRYDAKAEDNESPVHEVDLAPFFLSKYETTQGQWQRAFGRNPSGYPAGARLKKPAGLPRITWRHPVETVSWAEAMRFARETGCLLPTEAQWEYGARGGTDTVWFTGDDALSLKGHANLFDESAIRSGSRWHSQLAWPGHDDGFPVHAPAGSFAPNGFGIHDTAGNVREWCADAYDAYTAGTVVGTGQRKSSRDWYGLRGGDYSSKPWDVRSANRHGSEPEAKSHIAGFRVARVLER